MSGAGSRKLNGGVVLGLDVDHHRHRLLQDVFAAGLAHTWQRRATAFEAARPRLSDYNGHATAADLAERDRRCAAIAEACRHRASLALGHDSADLAAEITQVLEEVAA